MWTTMNFNKYFVGPPPFRRPYLFDKPIPEDAEQEYLAQGVQQVADGRGRVHVDAVHLEVEK